MTDVIKYLKDFSLGSSLSLFDEGKRTTVEYVKSEEKTIPKFVNEYWTAKQRQSNALHEISYRACFKAQLPRFFINLLTKEKELIFDPFSGRGTTSLEAALLNRNFIANDINPLSEILLRPRLQPPEISEIDRRLNKIEIDESAESDIDLTMFYHHKTLRELLSIKKYLEERKANQSEDHIDRWIKMVATNRLTGHSKGFFSAYTLPPNQAASPESQLKINKKRNQSPEYRNVFELIISKSISLQKDLTPIIKHKLNTIENTSRYTNLDAANLNEMGADTVDLTVTSPPFLNIVQYAKDNWLRCWFNNINADEIEKKIVMAKTVESWSKFIGNVFKELYRITKKGGFVAFETGEVKNGKVNLDEIVVEIGINKGFEALGIVINEQLFTKTANIWGVNNNTKGTNTNRIALFRK